MMHSKSTTLTLAGKTVIISAWQNENGMWEITHNGTTMEQDWIGTDPDELIAEYVEACEAAAQDVEADDAAWQAEMAAAEEREAEWTAANNALEEAMHFFSMDYIMHQVGGKFSVQYPTAKGWREVIRQWLENSEAARAAEVAQWAADDAQPAPTQRPAWRNTTLQD